jgi:GNAT superfamily N-acetyltransferase
MVRVEFYHGEAMRAHLPTLGRLRITVFREWPYLYDGSGANEAGNSSRLAGCPRAGLAVAFDGDESVGCATCLPLADEHASVQAPFLSRGWDLGRFFYFAESVLLPAYRGRGLGVTFMTAREAFARDTSAADFATFCAVQRPAEHPLRPPRAVSLDAFWRNRGFVEYPDLASTMRWKQVDAAERVENRLVFWLKPLRGAPLPS